ncbi:MAG: beta-N-acetylhexosaminidase [Chloroflexota bacterium]|nr:beta-N-acetylhexosaminidase [Chloroflexota bacterium]
MRQSVRELVGQSLMLSFDGCHATTELLNALAETRANGVILFARNIGSPHELWELNRALQSHAAAIGSPPLLISIDQEGGIVSRLPAPFTTMPSQMAQAATGDPEIAYRCAFLTGRQLRASGINTNFAPVLDVNNNPANPVIGTRSFGADPGLVAMFGLAALRGYADAGVIATAKHFPGHGDTEVDSHLGLPRVAHGRSRLDQVELAPFVAAFAADTPAVMTAHIIFSALDDVPATLSRRILTDLLRHELGYNGVVFTDALTMQAIAALYGPAEAALRSKLAGADVLLPLGMLDDQIAVARALCSAVEDGTVPRAMFEATADRLARLRAKYSVQYALPPFAAPDPAVYAEALDIARRSITMVHNRALLPLAPATRLVLIDCLLPRFSLVEEALAQAATFQALVAETFSELTTLVIGPEPSDEEIAQAVGLLRRGDVAMFVSRNATHIPRQLDLARALCAAGKPVIHVAARSPYDAGLVVDAAAALVTYGDSEVSLCALVEVLAGQTLPRGQAPVELPFASSGKDT